MAATVIGPKPWYASDYENVLTKYLPDWCMMADVHASSITTKVSDIKNLELYKSLGYDTFDAYATEVLNKPLPWFDQVAKLTGEIGQELADVRLSDKCKAAADNPIAEHGTNQYRKDDGVDNINSTGKAKGGTSQEYTLRRLARDRPDLLTEVEQGNLSPNQAAIAAGFRRKMVGVPVDSATDAVKVLLRHFTVEQLLSALQVTNQISR